MNSLLKLLLVGDVMLGRQVNECLRTQPPAYAWGNMLPLFLGADWRACNLECAITDQGTPWARSPKTYHFRSDAGNTAVLQAAQMDVVSLANNHTLDFNYRGMVEMLKRLDSAGIAHAGAGLNQDEASRMVVTEVKGVRIGFLAFTDNEPGWEAGDDHPGTYYVPVDDPDERTAMLISLVSVARAGVDLLIVSAHWGGNQGCQPPFEHPVLAHALIRAGADVIFGHSPHVCRGVEVFEGGLILYSTGDFVDDYAVDPIEHNDRSWAWEIQVEDQQIVRLLLHPAVIRDFQARRAEPELAQDMMNAMQELCAPFGTVCTIPAGPPRLVVEVRQPAGIGLEPAPLSL